MSKKTHLVVTLCCVVAMIIESGCANKEVVKSEEPITSKALSANTTPAIKSDKQVTSKVNEMKAAHNAQVKSDNEQAEKSSAMQAHFEKIYFDFDSADLSKDARGILSDNAETMMKIRPKATITIEGNCDERGSAEYNLALGERRAKSAMEYLVTLGVPGDRIKIISYGKEKPAVQGNDETAWAKNRRDEFVVQK